MEKRHPEGDFGRVVKSLIDAGSPWDALSYPTGDARIDNVLEPRMHERIDGAALVGDEAAVTRLLGANGSTALDIALERGREDIIQLLQEFKRRSTSS